MRTLKKYGNRRLYDTARSCYINIDEVVALIRAGEQIQVQDAKTGEDLTRHVLFQALLESQSAADLFPSGLLHRIIRYSANEPVQRVILKQLSVGLEMLDAQLSRLELQFPWMGGFPPSPPPAAPPPPKGEPEPEPEEEEEPPPPTGGREEEDLKALRARLAALEERLKR